MKTIPPHLAVPAKELRILDIPLGQGYGLLKLKKITSLSYIFKILETNQLIKYFILYYIKLLHNLVTCLYLNTIYVVRYGE